MRLFIFSWILRESSEVDLDASFILEDARLKLIHSSSSVDEKTVYRRQSLATTMSSAKVFFDIISKNVVVIFNHKNNRR